MQLTKEQWEKLNEMTLKERVERLEELMYDAQRELSDIRLREFNEEMNAIDDEYDKHCLRAIITAMILVWMWIWVLITKLVL